MLTPAEIKAKGFKKDLLGYNVEEVDGFLIKLYESYEAIYSENAELTEKIDLLIDRIEQYRRDESVLKDSIISTQKLNDSIIREANKRAELILRDAQIKGEKLIENAQRAIVAQKQEFDELKLRIADFRERILASYKQHLEEIRTLPVFEDKSDYFTVSQEPESDEARPVAEVRPKPSTITWVKPEPAAEPEPEPEAQPEAVAESAPSPEPEPEPQPEPEEPPVPETPPIPAPPEEPEAPAPRTPVSGPSTGDTREFDKVPVAVPAAKESQPEAKPFKLNINFDEEIASAVPENIREDLRFGADYNVEDEEREGAEGGVFSRFFKKRK